MKILLTAATVLFALVAAQVSAEEEIDAEKGFEDWAAFRDGGDCWIATFFEHKKADEVFTTYYFITFHDRSPQPRISIIPSSNYKTGLFLPLNVGGVIYELRDVDGDSRKLDVSYSGFRDAYNYLSRSCEFDYTPRLSDIDGVEPT